MSKDKFFQNDKELSNCDMHEESVDEEDTVDGSGSVYNSSHPHPVDVYVGKRLKALRILRNMIQSELGRSVNITTQQIQKYECGQNRISASRLYDFACKLGVSVNYFFLGLGNSIATGASARRSDQDIYSLSENINIFDQSGVFEEKKTISLISNFIKIKDSDMRDCIANMVKSAAKIDESN